MIYCIYLFIYFCGSEDNCLDALTTPYLYIQYFFYFPTQFSLLPLLATQIHM